MPRAIIDLALVSDPRRRPPRAGARVSLVEPPAATTRSTWHCRRRASSPPAGASVSLRQLLNTEIWVAGGDLGCLGRAGAAHAPDRGVRAARRASGARPRRDRRSRPAAAPGVGVPPIPGLALSTLRDGTVSALRTQLGARRAAVGERRDGGAAWLGWRRRGRLKIAAQGGDLGCGDGIRSSRAPRRAAIVDRTSPTRRPMSVSGSIATAAVGARVRSSSARSRCSSASRPARSASSRPARRAATARSSITLGRSAGGGGASAGAGSASCAAGSVRPAGAAPHAGAGAAERAQRSAAASALRRRRLGSPIRPRALGSPAGGSDPVWSAAARPASYVRRRTRRPRIDPQATSGGGRDGRRRPLRAACDGRPPWATPPRQRIPPVTARSTHRAALTGSRQRRTGA